MKKKNTKGCGIKTVVKGVRAEQSFWDKCDVTAQEEHITRNDLIIKSVDKYCEDKNGRV